MFYSVLDGQNYVPQHRERILIVGFDRERFGDDIQFDFDLAPKVPRLVMRDILDKEVEELFHWMVCHGQLVRGITKMIRKF